MATRLDVLATTGGKATVATTAPNSWDKIRLKAGPKQYKSGQPRVTGAARLERQVVTMLRAATRLQEKTVDLDEQVWCEDLARVLRDFLTAARERRAAGA